MSRSTSACGAGRSKRSNDCWAWDTLTTMSASGLTTKSEQRAAIDLRPAGRSSTGTSMRGAARAVVAFAIGLLAVLVAPAGSGAAVTIADQDDAATTSAATGHARQVASSGPRDEHQASREAFALDARLRPAHDFVAPRGTPIGNQHGLGVTDPPSRVAGPWTDADLARGDGSSASLAWKPGAASRGPDAGCWHPRGRSGDAPFAGQTPEQMEPGCYRQDAPVGPRAALVVPLARDGWPGRPWGGVLL